MLNGISLARSYKYLPAIAMSPCYLSTASLPHDLLKSAVLSIFQCLVFVQSPYASFNLSRRLQTVGHNLSGPVISSRPTV